MDLRASGLGPETELCRRRTRMGWRQPVHFPGLPAHALTGLEAAVDHPPGHHRHLAVPATEPVGPGDPRVKPLATEVAFATPWFEILAKTMKPGEAPYYSLRLP